MEKLITDYLLGKKELKTLKPLIAKDKEYHKLHSECKWGRKKRL